MQTLFTLAAMLGAPALQPLQDPPQLASLVWSDFDRDGYEDALALHCGELFLFRNAASGLEDQCAQRLGLAGLPPLAAAGWIDYDLDGSPDVFAVTRAGAPLLLRNESGEAFLDLTEALGLAAVGPILRAEWNDVDSDGEPDLQVWTREGIEMLRNTGGTFEAHKLSLPAPEAGPGVGSAESEEDPSVSPAREQPVPGSARTERADRSGRRGNRVVASPAPVSDAPASVRDVLPSIGFTTSSICAQFVADGDTGNCIVTSSVPALGQLYPMSPSLNVTRTGLVGMGTTSPLAQLHVTGPGTALRAEGPDRAAFLRSTSTTTQALRVQSPGTAGFFDGRLEVGLNFLADLPRAILDVDSKNAGTFELRNGAGLGTFTLEAQEFAGDGSQLKMFTAGGKSTVDLDAENGTLGGRLALSMASGTTTVIINSEESAGNGAKVNLLNSNGSSTFVMDANTSTGGSEFSMYMNTSPIETVEILSEEAVGNGAQMTLRNANAKDTFVVDANSQSTGGSELSMYMNSNGVESVQILSEESPGNGAEIRLRNGNGTSTMVLDANTQATGGSLFEMFAVNGQETVEIASDQTLGTGARIVLRKYDGTATIILDANDAGDGRITTQELKITGGADLVESFDTGAVVCEPGTVVVIDVERPGELAPSSEAYDARVAGVVSGAGGVNPGIQMGQEGVASGSTLVALTGRVFVRCSSENGPIRPGDLLTTSSTPGCAMRATDAARSFGAVLGKAMTNLDDESGLVLTLVNLQ